MPNEQEQIGREQNETGTGVVDWNEEREPAPNPKIPRLKELVQELVGRQAGNFQVILKDNKLCVLIGAVGLNFSEDETNLIKGILNVGVGTGVTPHLDKKANDDLSLFLRILKAATLRALSSGSAESKLVWGEAEWAQLKPDIRDYWLNVARTVFQTPGLNWRYPSNAFVAKAAEAVYKLSHQEKGPPWQELGDEKVFYEDLVWAVLDVGDPKTVVYRDVTAIHVDDESIVLKSGFGNVELRDFARLKMLVALQEKTIKFSGAAKAAFEAYQNTRGVPADWEGNAHLHMAWTAAVAASAACLITPDQTNTRN